MWFAVLASCLCVPFLCAAASGVASSFSLRGTPVTMPVLPSLQVKGASLCLALLAAAADPDLTSTACGRRGGCRLRRHAGWSAVNTYAAMPHKFAGWCDTYSVYFMCTAGLRPLGVAAVEVMLRRFCCVC